MSEIARFFPPMDGSICRGKQQSWLGDRDRKKHDNQRRDRILHSFSARKSRKRAEYCFESTVSEKRTHWASVSFRANSVSSAKNSVSSLWHTNNRLRGTHWAPSPELGEGKKNSLSSVFETVLSETVFGPCPKIGLCSPHFGDDLLTKLHRKAGERKKSTGENSKNLVRQRPEIADVSPLSWSKRVLRRGDVRS